MTDLYAQIPAGTLLMEVPVGLRVRDPGCVLRVDLRGTTPRQRWQIRMVTEATMRRMLPDDSLDSIDSGLGTVDELAQDAARLLSRSEASCRG